MFTKWILLAKITFAVLCYSNLLVAKEIKLATQPIGNTLTKQAEPYINCAMSMLDQPFKIYRVPWKRAQVSTKFDKYHGFFMASKNKERDTYATLSEPFVTIKWIYVTSKERKISPLDLNFNTRLFAAHLGSARHKWLDEQFNKGLIQKGIVTFTKSEILLKMLLLNRIDVALFNNIDFEQLVKNVPVNMSEIEVHIQREIPTGIYFSNTFIAENPSFLERFNSTLTQCKTKLK